MSARDELALSRSTSFETFESRIVFSVDAFAGNAAGDLILQGEIDQQDLPAQYGLNEAHQSTGAEYVFNDYGFDGSGQTIAVIDSGIAWDHFALGGGFGEDYRVVGGWDFAEGDANPYDDGPAGFHGTHVSGIIGSTDVDHRGVAPGVDLVGLRVFGDNGAGNIDWVEQALQWVHDHKDDFANPITTVNLSLGVDWNADNVPEWATLEDEFAQLEADNIFISVAAGNAFRNYNSTGLAYPAVSDHVVPVASHDANGQFSDFSQRNDRVLVAPGKSIQNTAPGHLFGTSQTDAFVGASGTSMAAPYVAGASAVLREAMNFMGRTDVNQDALYEHFRATADQFHDAVTGGYYHRLDLGAAVDAIINDAHGSSQATATQLGTVTNGDLVQGTIGKITDVDAFSFTAGRSGTLTLNVNQSHDLVAAMQINGHQVQLDGNTATFDVVAGQSYTVSLSTDLGLGHYDIDFDIAETFSAVDVGQIAQNLVGNQSVSGDAWYSLTASRDGILTANVANTGMSMEIYDSSMNLVTQSSSVAGQLRADAVVQGGQRYFVKLTGTDSGFDLQLNNQVSLQGGLLKVFGTAGNDTISVDHQSAGGQILVSIGDTDYQFSASQVQHVIVDGLAGNDQFNLNLQGGSDKVTLAADRAFVTTENFTLATGSFDSINAVGDTTDELIFFDSAGNDQFDLSGTASSMTGDGFRNQATGFTNVKAVAGQGYDTANINGSEGADLVAATRGHVALENSNITSVSIGFDHFNVQGHGGEDTIVINGEDNARFEIQGQHASAKLNQTTINADGFESTNAISYGASGSAILRGTNGDDVLHSEAGKTTMSGNGYRNSVVNVDDVISDAGTGGGFDFASIKDSTGNDQLVGNHYHTRITGNGTIRQAYGFDSVIVIAENGGADHAVFTGTRGRDVMYSDSNSTWLSGARYNFGVVGFDSVVVNGGGGRDGSFMQGGNDNTQFDFSNQTSHMRGTNYSVRATDFDIHRFDGGGGQNSVRLDGFEEQDRLTAEGSALIAYLDGATVRADNFVWLEAETGNDHVSEKEIGAVDFWYALHGDWDDAGA